MTFYDGSATSASALIMANGEVQFRVKACNSVGCSGWSGYQHVILQSGGIGLPRAKPAHPASTSAAAHATSASQGGTP